jgi:hypothetical protein
MKRHWIPRLVGFALVGLLVGAIGLATNETYYGYDPVRSLSADKRQMFAYTDRWRHHVRLAVGNNDAQFIGSPVVPYLGPIVRLEFDDRGEQLRVAYEHGNVVYRVQATGGRARAKMVSITMNEEALSAR